MKNDADALGGIKKKYEKSEVKSVFLIEGMKSTIETRWSFRFNVN